MWEPLYSPTQGGPFGYRCKLPERGASQGTVGYKVLCNKVCRTYRGIVMHCLRVHNVRAQIELFDEEKTRRKANAEYVRAAEQLRECERREVTSDLFAARED